MLEVIQQMFPADELYGLVFKGCFPAEEEQQPAFLCPFGSTKIRQGREKKYRNCKRREGLRFAEPHQLYTEFCKTKAKKCFKSKPQSQMYLECGHAHNSPQGFCLGFVSKTEIVRLLENAGRILMTNSVKDTSSAWTVSHHAPTQTVFLRDLHQLLTQEWY